MMDILSKIWEWLLAAGVVLLGVMYFAMGKNGKEAFEEADKKLRKKGEDLEKKKESVEKEKEKTKEKIEDSQEKVDELKEKRDNVEGETTSDPEELKDWVEGFSNNNE